MWSEPAGFVKWHDWFFDYDMADTEGLTLLHGHFSGQHVFHKLSLPVIRVKYTQDEDITHNHILGNGCGPYNDRIKWDPETVGDFFESQVPFHGPHQLVKVKCAGEGTYICKEELFLAGAPWLKIGVYARIGAYHIVQAWLLGNDGRVFPRVWSKGLSCNLDHWHHPYWRFHLRLGDSPRHRLDVYNGNQQVQAAVVEESFVNAAIGWEPRYIISSLDTPFRATITPPQIDRSRGIVGPESGPQPFSSLDACVRRFRPEEDRPWPHKEEEDIGFPVHENILGHELVFWSVNHLEHHANEGKDHWHSVGPEIRFEIPRLRAPLPHEVRRVTVECTFHIKDYKLVGSDLWSHQPVQTQIEVLGPNEPHGAMVFWSQTAGDVTANLLVKVDWNADSSVAVHLFAKLFDEDEMGGQAEKHFNVLQDSAVSLKGHLTDKHAGDPDTADIDIVVTNAQYA